jgi:uncharacterized LabA/DUF88 family protein
MFGRYAYIDGESHFFRTVDVWKRLHGENADLADAAIAPDCPGRAELPIWCHSKARFFWDSDLLRILQYFYKELQGEIHTRLTRGFYFTSFVGNPDLLHDSRVYIRRSGFDPQISLESRQDESNRRNLLQAGIIEKAKAVDIGLAVRMLEDAARNNYADCYLFTSDRDYVPLIRAVQGMGKVVWVFGHKENQARRSELEYVPDRFIDIGEDFMRKRYALKKPSEEKQESGA